MCRIARRRNEIEDILRRRRQKVWPTATAARLLDIGPSLLRKWVLWGVIARYRPPEYHRSGIPERRLRAFLRQLCRLPILDTESMNDCRWGPYVPDYLLERLDTSRIRPAEERCRQAAKELSGTDLFDPAVFARKAGVSVSTVHRLLRAGVICAWYPSPHRPKICGSSEKHRRNRLTRKIANRAEKAV